MFRFAIELLLHGVDMYFELTVGVHRQICLAGYVDQDFAGTFREELYL